MTRSTQIRVIPHPGGKLDPDRYAMAQVEGLMTRREVKAEAYGHMYGVPKLDLYPHQIDGLKSLLNVDFAAVEERVMFKRCQNACCSIFGSCCGCCGKHA